MPTLHGYHEHIRLNAYDSVNPRTSFARSPSVTMFSNANVGREELCSITMHGCVVAPDQTAFLLNWYARTNLPADSACQAQFDAWTHVTVAQFVLGSMPVCWMPLSDLLREKPGQRPEYSWQRAPSDDGTMSLMEVRDHRRMALAHEMWDRAHAPNTWELASQAERDTCVSYAGSALSVMREPLLAIVPRRQNCNVILNTNPSALGALLEVMPTNVAPQTLVWVHLEGFARRDVC